MLILAQLTDYKNKVPQTANAKISISDSTIDLGNGSIGLGRSGRNVDYVQNIASTEDEQRSYFDVSLKNVTLSNIDDFVVAGGFKTVDFDHVEHKGRMNLSLHGGNSRKYGAENKKTGWEYGIKDLEERISRSEKDQDCERCRRWKATSDLDSNIAREFLDVTDSWIVEQDRKHLETTIQINNSNLSIDDGFLHLMAKNIRLKDSTINLNFAKNWKYDSEFPTIPKVSINGDTQLDNSHLNIRGAKIDKKFGTAAGLFFVGDLLGKNKSSVFIKTDDGYTVRTNGNSRWHGEKDKDDLKVTILNLGNSYDPEKYKNGVDITADYPELGNTGFSLAATKAKVLFENLSLTIIAPNGAPAYYSSKDLGIETKNADFSYYERPRTYKQQEANITGTTKRLNLSDKQVARLVDSLSGVQATNLSTDQSQQSAENQATLSSELALQSVENEKDVHVQVCIDGEECKNVNLGNQHSEATVNVGEIQ
ncbi:hypothetical protein B0186_07645 [Canicola haemoglobinophilus]|uniref:Heme/hemopexin-binding protein A (Heme:hemopexin utilization protein A) n=1 Tax=Canicola haemoglobinophilus TaxID=733 RepID=A0A1V4B086_9PAST|nr:hypothetical protein [Canicola haemoglobinophilus]OOR99486.1 hypothetical protein B0186_07645 [Canicola haemoglobinophilus]STO59734.1 heme/hemopexin-binding protein A (Heme:hemopexin utilization protein A) [Canicola haemoglobinophilus]